VRSSELQEYPGKKFVRSLVVARRLERGDLRAIRVSKYLSIEVNLGSEKHSRETPGTVTVVLTTTLSFPDKIGH